MNSPKIIVVIVNYCTANLVIDCLESLAAERTDFHFLSTVVADNASLTGPEKKIAAAVAARGWSSWATVKLLPKNGGFAYGNNSVIGDAVRSPAQPDYFWLLNSDTVVRRGALKPLIDLLTQNPAAGIAGSGLEDPDGTPQHSAFQFPSIASEFESSIGVGLVTRLLERWVAAPPVPDKLSRFDWLSGASLLIRPEVFKSAGLFDEEYFLYYEESDLCLRAHKNGWECWYVPESRVVHLVGASTGVTARQARSKRRAPYWFESRRRYFIKHHGRLYASGVDMALLGGTALNLLKSKLQRRNAQCPEKFLYDLARHSAIFGAGRV